MTPVSAARTEPSAQGGFLPPEIVAGSASPSPEPADRRAPDE